MKKHGIIFNACYKFEAVSKSKKVTFQLYDILGKNSIEQIKKMVVARDSKEGR